MQQVLQAWRTARAFALERGVAPCSGTCRRQACSCAGSLVHWPAPLPMGAAAAAACSIWRISRCSYLPDCSAASSRAAAQKCCSLAAAARRRNGSCRSGRTERARMQQHGIASALHIVLSQLPACRLLTAACITTLPPTRQVPPALNRFTRTLDKNMAESLFKLLMKYRPEDKAAKKERLLKEAQVCCWGVAALDAHGCRRAVRLCVRCCCAACRQCTWTIAPIGMAQEHAPGCSVHMAGAVLLPLLLLLPTHTRCLAAPLPAPACLRTQLRSWPVPPNLPLCRRVRLARRLRRRSRWWSSTASTTSRSWWRAARRSEWVSAAARCRPRLCCVRVSFVRWGERRETAGTAARRSGRARQAQHALFAPQRSAVGMAWLGLQHSVAGAIQQAGTGAGVPR